MSAWHPDSMAMPPPWPVGALVVQRRKPERVWEVTAVREGSNDRPDGHHPSHGRSLVESPSTSVPGAVAFIEVTRETWRNWRRVG